jgi:hypothetical protein
MVERLSRTAVATVGAFVGRFGRATKTRSAAGIGGRVALRGCGQ